MFAASKSLHYVSIFCYKNTYQYILKMYIKMNNDIIDDWW